MPSAHVIVWFRQDLRLADNPALAAAARTDRAVLCVYIRDDSGEPWQPGGAARWWLHGSLEALAGALAAKGARLILRTGAADAVLCSVAAEIKADTVYWNRRVEPWAAAQERKVEAALAVRGVAARRFNASLLFEPDEIATKSGAPYRVFTPFWTACRKRPEPPQPRPAPACLRVPRATPRSEALASWRLRPTRPDWAAGLRVTWTPGEAGAAARLSEFLDGVLSHYRHGRDRPHGAGTSRLSPHLHWGEIGPRQVWHAVRAAAGTAPDAEAFLRELGWREFSHHLLHHFPHLPERSLRREFERVRWSSDRRALAAWRRGRTGYPIVDAGMRELWATGWMHNRVRMITASFLVKDLLVAWQRGAAWFWDTLVDADLANNSASWQWVAGCGTDAAPFFRIFNPVRQGEKFDPDGGYVRRWVPELAGLDAEWIHRPWTASPETLRAAGVVLDQTYPRPIVEHGEARARALAAFAELRAAA